MSAAAAAHRRSQKNRRRRLGVIDFYAQQTAKSQSHTHIIIVMLQCFMHFNAKRSFSLNLIALITLHSQCDWLLHYISQYSMVDGEISYTLQRIRVVLSDSKVHCINSSQLLTHLKLLTLSFVAILQIRL